MATSPQGLKERLRGAHRSLSLAGDALPDDLRPDFQWVTEALTEEPDKGEGTVAATLEAMGDERAMEIADRIFSLAYRVFTRQDP